MTTVLDRYGKVLGELAADGRGEGRLVSVTFLSQQMPFGGRDTAGGGGLPVPGAIESKSCYMLNAAAPAN